MLVRPIFRSFADVARTREGLSEEHRDIYDVMAKQTTVRLPEELAEQAEGVAGRRNQCECVIVESLSAEMARVRADKDFTSRADRLLKRDKELLDRLAR